jgi:hypothetical protein
MAFQFQWEPVAADVLNKLEAAAKESFENRKKSKRTKSSKQEGLFKQVVKSLHYLQTDPSLCCHVYHGLQHPYDPNDKVWEAYAQNKTPAAYRIFWCYGPKRGIITILAITQHP